MVEREGRVWKIFHRKEFRWRSLFFNERENFFKCQTLDEKILIPSVLPRFHPEYYLKYVHVSKQVLSRVFIKMLHRKKLYNHFPTCWKCFFFFSPFYKFFFDSNFASSKIRLFRVFINFVFIVQNENFVFIDKNNDHFIGTHTSENCKCERKRFITSSSNFARHSSGKEKKEGNIFVINIKY